MELSYPRLENGRIIYGPDSATAKRSPSLVNLNTASADELQAVGFTAAQVARIEEHRQNNGPFSAVDELQSVPRIGVKVIEAVRERVTV